MIDSRKLWDELRDEEFADAYADEFLNTSIATQIKVIREQRKLTQQQLAELSGMKQERISVLENVNYSSWSVTTLRRLAKAFGLTLRVSFETFSTRLDDMRKADRSSLERKSRQEEIRDFGERGLGSSSILKQAAQLQGNAQSPASVLWRRRPQERVRSTPAPQFGQFSQSFTTRGEPANETAHRP